MKQLQKNFTGIGEVKGFEFTQISETDKGFIYLVDAGSTSYYEVFKRKENTRFNTVSYPTSKAFGIWAWSVKTLEQANEKLESFNQ